MSSDTSTPDAATAPDADAEEEAPRDEQREAIAARLVEALGDGVVAHHIRPGDDLWVRVTREAWAEAGRVARDRLGCRTLGFISAIDWLPSPYGRYLDSEVDNLLAAAAAGDATEADAVAEADAAEAAGDAVAVEPGDEQTGSEAESATPTIETGYAGGDTRFQVFARVLNIKEHWGFTLKVDVPDDDLRVDTWVANYAGANWHERECWEMFGIVFEGHPFLRKLYLPGEFEGHPLRKDFPLLARMVKAWPGIVDVEDMPPLPEEDDGDKDGDAPAADGSAGDVPAADAPSTDAPATDTPGDGGGEAS